jgi:hypothetical protein
MQPFFIDDTTYHYPTSWAEVPYHQFVQLTAIRSTDTSPMRKAGDTVALLTGVPRVILDAAEPRLVLTILEAMPFLGEEPTEAVVSEFGASGETFLVRDLDDATFGQFAAFEDIAYRHKKQPLLALPKQLVMLCRKPGEDGRDLPAAEFERRAALFDNLPTTTVLGVASGFTVAARSTQAVTVASSVVAGLRAALLTQLEKNIMTGLDGLGRPIPTLRKCYARLIRWCLA